MYKLVEILSEINVISIFVRMVLAMILCGVIGIERGIKNRPAGFMTYLLVGCGSTLIEGIPGITNVREVA